MAIVSTYPVNLTYNYGPNVGTINTTYTSSEGIIYNITPLLSAVQDVSFNQNSLNILSNNYLLSDSLSGTKRAQLANYVISTTLSVVLADGSTNYFYVSGSGYNIPVVGLTNSTSKATVFDLTFNGDYTLSVSNSGRYVTVDSTTVLKVLSYDALNYSTTQSFNYNLYGNQISLFNVSDGRIACISTSLLTSYNKLKLFLNTFTSFNSFNTSNSLNTFNTSNSLHPFNTSNPFTYSIQQIMIPLNALNLNPPVKNIIYQMCSSENVMPLF